jgi:hemolysin activation/secretion protein
MTLRKKSVAAALIIAAGFLYIDFASAQQAVPQSVSPGQLKNRVERTKEPKGVFRAVVPLPEKRLPGEEAKKIRFVLAGTVIVGSTVYKPEELLPLYRDLIATKISLADMYAVTDKITAKYNADGYLLTEVIIPPQKAEFGVVRIEIIEASIEEVTLRGEVKGDQSLLLALGRKITASKPLRRDTLERYILLINDLPGVSAEPSLAPIAGQRGSFAMTIDISHMLADGQLGLDNRGSKSVGPFQLQAVANLNSLFGNYENIRLTVIETTQFQELQYASVDYSHPLNAEGTVASVSVWLNKSEPGGLFETSDIDSTGRQISLTVSTPIIRMPKEFLQVSGRFEISRYATETTGAITSKDRTRVIRAALNYAVTNVGGSSTRIGGEISQGLNIFNARESGSVNLSTTNGRSDFTKVTFQGSRHQILGAGFSILGAFKGQYSASSLLSSEQFAFGGSQFGRAYDPSEITGDHGIASKLELQYILPIKSEILKQTQLYTYFDRGDIWTMTPDSGEKHHQSGAAVGGGVRYSLGGGISGYLELAKPLTRAIAERDQESGNNIRIFFQLAIPL